MGRGDGLASETGTTKRRGQVREVAAKLRNKAAIAARISTYKAKTLAAKKAVLRSKKPGKPSVRRVKSLTRDSEPFKEWRNEAGELHRTDGPAAIYPDGREEWWINGRHHREDGPAVTSDTGTEVWYKEGLQHRIDGPARIVPTQGVVEWWVDGKLHREDGPALVSNTDGGTEEWYRDGKLHREDGPAVTRKVPGEHFADKDHRYSIGIAAKEEWHKNGELHREDGPAKTYSDGRKEWWIDGKQLNEEEFAKVSMPAGK